MIILTFCFLKAHDNYIHFSKINMYKTKVKGKKHKAAKAENCQRMKNL